MQLSDVFKGFEPISLKNANSSLLAVFLNSQAFRTFIAKALVNIKYRKFPSYEKIHLALRELYIVTAQYWLEHQELLGKTSEAPYEVNLDPHVLNTLPSKDSTLKLAIEKVKDAYNTETQPTTLEESTTAQKQSLTVPEEFETFLTKFYECTTAQVITYLLGQGTIINPLGCNISEKARDSAAKDLHTSPLNSTNIPPAFKKKLKKEPIIFGQQGTKSGTELAQFYTAQERYKTPMKRYANKKGVSALDIVSQPHYMPLYDIVKTAFARKRGSGNSSHGSREPINSKTLEFAMAQGNYLPSSFKGTSLYEVILFIKYMTEKGFFNAHPDFNIYYDPCAGWGERVSAAYLSKDHFKELYVNDLNKDLEAAYSALINYLQQTYPYKKVTFTTQDALDVTPPVKVDFVFSGLPFFNTEEYLHSNIEKYTNYRMWLETFCLPLMARLVDVTRPGGYIAVNLGKDREGNSLSQGLLDLIAQTPTVKGYITEKSFSVSKGLYYHSAKSYSSQMLIFQKEDHSFRTISRPISATTEMAIENFGDRYTNHASKDAAKPVQHMQCATKKPFKIIRSPKSTDALANFGLLGHRNSTTLEKDTRHAVGKEKQGKAHKKVRHTLNAYSTA